MSKTLKACPFCGEEPSTRTSQDESLWSKTMVTWLTISCSTCGISMHSEEQDEVIAQWNTRRRGAPKDSKAVGLSDSEKEKR